MRLITGHLDYRLGVSPRHVRLFTGNPIVRKDGCLVMGRGAARQVRDLYPGIDKAFGERMASSHRLTFVNWNGQKFGWFQVKHHWADKAQLDLIQESAVLLDDIARQHSGYTFHLNAPGIGNGQLQWDDVRPLLVSLPDNVVIYR